MNDTVVTKKRRSNVSEKIVIEKDTTSLSKEEPWYTWYIIQQVCGVGEKILKKNRTFRDIFREETTSIIIIIINIWTERLIIRETIHEKYTSHTRVLGVFSEKLDVKIKTIYIKKKKRSFA